MRIQTLLIAASIFSCSILIGCSGGSSTNANTAANAAAANTNHSEHTAHNPSSPGAANADYDLQFIDTMIAHHQAAIDMAKMLEERNGRAEVRKFGAKIVAVQQLEIDNMRSWRQKWFPGQAQAVNHELAGMADSMKDMDMAKLASLGGNEFDAEFVRQMIPHHEGAVAMAREAQTRSQKSEIKKLADDVIREQNAEIEMMKNWQMEWAGK